MNEIQNWLEEIIKRIVEQPEKVEIRKDVDEMGVLFTINVAEEDMGIVIGGSGRTIASIRHLVKIIGYKDRSRISVKLEEPKKHG